MYHTSVAEVQVVKLVCLSCATGIGLTLNGVQYNSNSVVTITDIGTGCAALFCTTAYIPCCLSTDGSHWYFPDGSRVQRTGTTYFRTRTFSGFGSIGAVHLHRNPGALQQESSAVTYLMTVEIYRASM